MKDMDFCCFNNILRYTLIECLSPPPPISILAFTLQYAPYVSRKVMFYGVLTHRHVSVMVSDIRRVGDGIDGGPSMT
jgi:hypothetical protein